MALLRRFKRRASDDVPNVPRPGVELETDEAAARDAALLDRDWSQLPDGARQRIVDAPSGALALIEAGDPAHPRVLLVPGVTGSKEDFAIMVPLLVHAGYFVQSYDLAGQYQSAGAGPENLAPPRPRYDQDLFVDDMIAVLEQGLPNGDGQPAHLLGYSFAGTVAAIVTLRRPDLVLSLALLSAPPLAGQAFRGVKRIGWLSRVLTPHAGARLMVFGIRHNLIPVAPGRVRFVRERFALTRQASIDDVIGLMTRTPDLRAELRTAGIPGLIAVGEHDLWPLEQHAAFAAAVNSRLAVYRTGHSPCETTPHQLVRDLVELYRLASPRSAL